MTSIFRNCLANLTLGFVLLLVGCSQDRTKVQEAADQTREHIVQAQDSVDRVRVEVERAKDDVGQAAEDLGGRARELADRAAEASERLGEKLDAEVSEVREGVQALAGDPNVDLTRLFDSVSDNPELSALEIRESLAFKAVVLETQVHDLKEHLEPVVFAGLTRDLEDFQAEFRSLESMPEPEFRETVSSLETKGQKLAAEVTNLRTKLP